MKKSLIFMAAMLAAVLAFAEPQFTLATKDAMPVYKCGEKAAFTFSVTDDGKPVKEGKYALAVTLGGGKILKKIPVDLAKANPVEFSETLSEPGFVLVRLLDEKNKPVMVPVPKRPGVTTQVLAGAAFDPEKIKMGYGCPKDFMQFWENNRKLLAGTPVELTRDERSNKDYNVWYVTIKSLNDHTLTGYLSIPTGKGPFPAYVEVPPAGPGAVGPVTAYAKQAITLIINVHQYPTARVYKEQVENHKKLAGNYPKKGAGSRDTYFYRAVYTGVDQAINYIASSQDWDHKHMVISGSSQGGGSALILSGLNKNITAMSANVPALCDHGGFKFDRQPGWPFLRGTPNVDEFAPYFDAGNFARFIKVPALVSCGFIDTTCHPASVYAAFNQIKSPKKMVCMPTTGHGSTAEYNRERAAFNRKHLGLE